jgi:hypothetical protein
MIKAILNDGEFNTKLPKETVEFVEQYLLDHNPLIKQLVIRDLWVQPNDTFKHNNFYFNGQVNNKIVRFSLLSTGRCSANPIKVDSVDYTINAMRTAVAGHIQHIKKYLLNVKRQTSCELCGKDLDLNNTDKIHMHHCGELQFRHIADQFLASNEKLVVADKKDQAGTYELVDNDAKDLWINFHNELAELQMVCATCNLTEKKL